MEETELGTSPGKDESVPSLPSLINPIIEQTLKRLLLIFGRGRERMVGERGEGHIGENF